jgi:hypothetical protein
MINPDRADMRNEIQISNKTDSTLDHKLLVPETVTLIIESCDERNAANVRPDTLPAVWI